MMDNTGCYPEDLAEKYSNIRIIFLPANCTSVLQPLNLEIMKNFKVHYCNWLWYHILTKTDTRSTAHDVINQLKTLLEYKFGCCIMFHINASQLVNTMASHVASK